ncbi:CD209 antigen-like protein E [Erpetoichthys calabaricus]|uniref:CD209 antigen-like protein E n=1 Tax=Erpetoichthys calabaricus TaxID=27687 RepID=UPI002234302F|nr:CD209 antigen-like protein E [Erpetoichthys calabaricus]
MDTEGIYTSLEKHSVDTYATAGQSRVKRAAVQPGDHCHSQKTATEINIYNTLCQQGTGHTKQTAESTSQVNKRGYLLKLALGLLFAILVVAIIFLVMYCKHCSPRPMEGRTCHSCPDNWLLFNYKCYIFSTNKMNWTSSRDDCILQGGKLAIIESLEEQTFLKSFTALKGGENMFYWIGLTDVDNEGQFQWIDGTYLDKNISFWGPKQPNNLPPGENCVLFLTLEGFTGWHDYSCKTLSRRICEREAHS